LTIAMNHESSRISSFRSTSTELRRLLHKFANPRMAAQTSGNKGF
uniref:Tick transposon n=1 Tax=Haemonchus placei TaxID=6290 RepID=A0A0N4X4L5_HAEPC